MDIDFKRERRLVKLLTQIESLEAQDRTGCDLLPEQLEKLRRRNDAETELEEIRQKTTGRRVSDISTCLDQASRSSQRKSYLSRRSLTIEEDPLGVGDLLPPTIEPAAQSKSEKKWHEDIRPFGSDFSKEYWICLQQIRELSQDCFGDDSTEKCSKRGGWHITVLTENKELLGFLVYKIRLRCLSIAYIAVPVEQRRRGYGKELIRWAQSYARKKSKTTGIDIVGLSSLKEAVPFYKAMGFAQVNVTKFYEDDNLIPGQVYMEYRINKRKKGL
eukprot:GEMP01073969.1.p1 GENE.GEMP01073969.1~~GEMP01073969.1.p1  ORF type:complete len:273 (+),score=35.60 GEMP01073969.1:44-862(+)